MVGVGIGTGFIPNGFIEGQETLTIKDKTFYGSRNGHYLVNTDVGIYEIDRPWWKMFDAPTGDQTYLTIDEGVTYKVKTYGFRYDAFEWYPFIYDIIE